MGKGPTMPIQLHDEDGGRILVVHVTGHLVKADYEHFVPEFEQYLELHGKPRLLFDMTGLHGWDVAAAWEDIKFDIKHFTDIRRLAMVGDKRWQHGMAVFFRPFTKATSRYLITRRRRQGPEVVGRRLVAWRQKLYNPRGQPGADVAVRCRDSAHARSRCWRQGNVSLGGTGLGTRMWLRARGSRGFAKCHE